MILSPSLLSPPQLLDISKFPLIFLLLFSLYDFIRYTGKTQLWKCKFLIDQYKDLYNKDVAADLGSEDFNRLSEALEKEGIGLTELVEAMFDGESEIRKLQSTYHERLICLNLLNVFLNKLEKL